MTRASSRASVLWSIEGADCPGTSYLMGTMHVRDRRAFSRWQQVIQKVETCEAFAAEIQIDQLKSMPGLLPAVAPLHQLLPERKFQKLRRQLRKGAGIDIVSCDHLPPVILLQLIDEALLARDYPASLDESLWNYAKMQGKELLGLETTETQLGFLRQLNNTFQVRQLLEVGSRWPRHRRQAMRMAALYEAEEIDRL
ncbi:MAG: TraB/GumN family protein [Saprospiraceae bacterium]|nr:TraB/GumN family protein [Saprospiraceae bacterium]